MRLIDADSLIELFTPWVSEDKRVTYRPRQLRTIAGIVEDIKNAPTVEAIPVEWILNSIKDMKPYYALWQQRMDLIKEWRQRNETD